MYASGYLSTCAMRKHDENIDGNTQEDARFDVGLCRESVRATPDVVTPFGLVNAHVVD